MFRLIFLVLSIFVTGHVLAKPLSIESFASLPDVQQLNLSPSGHKVAYIKNMRGTLVLRIIDVSTGKDIPILKTDDLKISLNWYEWANDDTLIFGVSYTSRERSIKYTSTRLLKFDLTKDKEPELLVRPKRFGDHHAQFQDNIVSLLPDDDEHILVAVDFDVANQPSVYRVNVKSRNRKRIRRSREDIKDWIADRQGNIRIGYGLDKTRVFYKQFGDKRADSRILFEYEVFSKDKVSIIGFDKDPNIIYVTAIHQGKDALYKVNLTDPNLTKELVYSDPNYDFDGRLIYSQKTGEVIGFTHSNTENGRVYWDKDRDRLQRSLNAALPDDNVVVIDVSKDSKSYIAYKSSKKDPGSYYYGNRENKAINLFAQRYPEINETVIAKKQRVSFEARDGLKIEGYLTLPNNVEPKNLPTVILPHGGPMARDYSGFDYWSQLFANQGYAVLQPNFRGSSGFGYEFEMSSVKQWGGAMQDDLQDGANWLVEQGYTNKNRICMVGGSYGGYAALMSVVKHPETFKCAASFAPVTDLEYIVSRSRHFTNKEVVRAQFGTDYDLLEAQSPINYAKEITKPILLVHGSDDKVVPVRHSRNMFDELEDEHKVVNYIELEGGDHHLSYQPHRIQTLTAITEFLKQHL